MKNGIGKILIGMFALVMLCSVSFASINPKLQLSDYSVSETPAQPGHTVALTLKYKSVEWDNCAERISVQLSASNPFSVQGPDTQYVDGLCFNDTAEKGTFTFLLPVDSLAQSGTYQITAVAGYEKRFSKFSESNVINVRVGGAPSVIASVVSSSPVDIYPGDTAAITLKFHNNGSSRIESAVAVLSASNGIEVKWAGEEQVLGQIQPRASASATFVLEVPKSIKPGNYRLSATLKYASEEGDAQTASFSFELPVKEKADFSASLEEGVVLASGEDKEVELLLTNVGYGEARNLKVRIKPLFPFSTDGTVRYVESLRAGETVKLAYLVHVDKDGTVGQQLASLLVDFEDADGKKFSDSADFSLSVEQKSLEEKLLEYWYVGAVAVVIAVIVGVRRMRKK
ncbi:hypothetical protein COV61_03190 [Candidatus Micrarchaeota archaeon CG11_big_fil_rev_8_21_14_0_20_47_5]|nr:MAG: hypothetical protein AUJ17_00750 [Candidatus Micrarchaeota archaeon CG1_02_47_40]PIN83396.1 MAG: hypothetical protein COV61_03190 [Candidatus Micrarchaeota archaeon CG11_big_fil_rev_8_21_14_0_20_47_5]